MQVKDIFLMAENNFTFIPEIMIASAVHTVPSTQESNNRATVLISFGLHLSHCS